MKKFFKTMNRKVNNAMIYAKCAFDSRKGEGYVDTGVKALIAVVLGALILSGLYMLLNEDIDCTVYAQIDKMFRYTG